MNVTVPREYRSASTRDAKCQHESRVDNSPASCCLLRKANSAIKPAKIEKLRRLYL